MALLRFKIMPLVQVNPERKPIDIAKIRMLCAKGLDECPPEDRTIAWLVLSGVLPRSAECWPSVRASLRSEYVVFISEFSVVDYESKHFPNRAEFCTFGVPQESLMELIHGDVVRTIHHIGFFPNADRTVTLESSEDLLLPYHMHIRRIERILYLFAQLNRTIAYIQGFNELATVLFYVYYSSLCYFNDDELEVEALTFYTFQKMFSVTALNELFSMEDGSTLVRRRFSAFMALLKLHLPRATDIINGHNIHPLCFSFRWINLLFAQEQQLPNLVLIWDALFARFGELVEYACYIAVAQVKMLERWLSADDYIATMTALQKMPVDDVKGLLRWAKRFWARDHTGNSDWEKAGV
jgi:hypothetical protein